MAPSILTSEFPASANLQSLHLRDILKMLPREVFLKDRRRAWLQVALNVGLVGLGYWGLAIAPWFLLPILWIFTGTALTGFFVLGHDCGHRSFANRKWVNNWVGHILMLPLIYPFHSWRILHNYHHKHTNKLGVDNAWDPFRPEFYDQLPKVVRLAYQAMRGFGWWLASIAHWAVLHFNWNRFEGQERQQVRTSVLVVVLGAAIAFPLLVVTTGWWGLVKFWLLPWLVYHFWMSTFTLVHHTNPAIPFTPPEQWHEAQAQLMGTVHCDYPAWVEFLCHDINVHIPHHISTAIPSYKLRQAHQVIKTYWGDHCQETRFSWALLWAVTTQCHLYDRADYYRTFEAHHNRTP